MEPGAGVTTASTPERTALYRIFGEDNLLLYIGISKDFGGRWKQHARLQPWRGEMRRLTVDRWYDERIEAEVAEELAIKAEKPKYNKVHAEPPVQRRAAPIRDAAGDEAFEQLMARRAARANEEPDEEPDDAPHWGWWPKGAWWRTWGRLVDADPVVLEAFYCPEHSATEAFGLLFRKRDSESFPFGWIQQDPKSRAAADFPDLPTSYSAHCVTEGCDRLGPLYGIQREFLEALLNAGRCSAVNVGENAVAFGFIESTEAMAATYLLVDLAWGNAETTLACLDVLKDRDGESDSTFKPAA